MSVTRVMTLKRCKSYNDVVSKPHDDSRSGTVSESSEVFLAPDRDSDSESDGKEDGLLGVLERKIDKLSDLFLEQCRLLAEIKEDIQDSKVAIEKSEHAQNKLIADLLEKALDNCTKCKQDPEPASASFNSRARSLLDAIESRPPPSLDRKLRDALADCLQSEELKERMVCAATASVRDIVRCELSREVSRVFVPAVLRGQRRLAKQLVDTLHDSFAELEAKAAQLSSSTCRVVRSLRRALDQHGALLKAGQATNFSYLRYVVEDTLQKEIQQWRHLALDALQPADEAQAQEWVERGATPPPLDYPDSPPQPAGPEISIIDQLMTTAEINKLIQDGAEDAAFERALSAGELSLVMAACRAADVSHVFAPCRLRQSTLLSLAQQLPTDMVHDTQLKCRYLEEALINLNVSSPATRAHLPLVVGDIRKNLTRFLASYPSHVASRRITLIIMAADNLLK